MNGRTGRIAAVFVLGVVPWGLLSSGQRTNNLDVAHIGFLGFRPLTESLSTEVLTALREGLRDVGRIEGRDYVLDVRSADNKADRFPELISELTRLHVKLIFAPSTPAAVAIHKANPNMPTVVRGPDIVGAGLARSVDHPGGMFTGIDEVGTGDTAKRLRLLKQAVPTISRVAMLGSAPSEAGHARAVAEAEQAARAIGVTLSVFRVSATTDLDRIFAGLRSDGVDALLCSGGILPRPVEQRIVVPDGECESRGGDWPHAANCPSIAGRRSRKVVYSSAQGPGLDMTFHSTFAALLFVLAALGADGNATQLMSTCAERSPERQGNWAALFSKTS